MSNYLGDMRIQGNMGTYFKEDYGSNRVSRLELGRVTKINYQDNTVNFILNVSDNKNIRASGNDTIAAPLPMNMAGRNGMGKAYGEVYPVHVNDIILVGFVEDKVNKPIVLGIYPDSQIANEVSQSDNNDIDPRSQTSYDIANTMFKLYPDQTYDFHDGYGTRALSFSGKSFMLVNANVPNNNNIPHKKDDGADPLDYSDLTVSQQSNGTTIEPLVDKAPEIVFKHQGIINNTDGKADNHALYVYVGQDGTYRVSEMQTNKPWRTYFEISENGRIHMVRQANSKVFGGTDIDGLDSSEIGIDFDGNAIMRNHNEGITVKKDGIYRLNGDKLITSETEINDLLNDKLGATGFGGANLFSYSKATENLYIEGNTGKEDIDNGAITSDYIEIQSGTNYIAAATNARYPMLLSLMFYDADKNFIEGTQVSGSPSVDTNTRVSPDIAVYARVSMDDKEAQLMFSTGYTPLKFKYSYADTKANKSGLTTKASKIYEDYLNITEEAKNALNDLTTGLNNLDSIVTDGTLSATDKIIVDNYFSTAKGTYEDDLLLAAEYEINTDAYKTSYNSLVSHITPLLSDMTITTAESAKQFKDAWRGYFSARYDVIGKIENSVESNYEDSKGTLDRLESEQSNVLAKQFSDVAQDLQGLQKTTQWQAITSAIDLNDEKTTENIFYQGDPNRITSSPITGQQYIQVFSVVSNMRDEITRKVTQKVWQANSTTSYTRVLLNDTWSTWTQDNANPDYDNKFSNLDTKVSSITDKVDNVDTTTASRVNTLSAELGTANGKISDLQNKTANLASNATSLSNTVTSNNKNTSNTISGMQTTLSNLESQITTIQNNLSALSTKVNSLDSKIASINTRVSSIDARIASVESDTTSIKNRLTTLENKPSDK